MASRSLNRVMIIGNLTRDPELKYTPNGTAVCTFGIATNRTWTTADGTQKEDVQYHRIVAWQKLAELCGKLLTKGRKVYLEGRITYRTFVGRDGLEKNLTEIVLDDFIVFSDGKRLVAEEEKPLAEETIPEEAEPVVEETVTEPDQTAKEDKTTKSTEEKELSSKTKKSSKKTEEENETVNPDDIPF